MKYASSCVVSRGGGDQRMLLTRSRKSPPSAQGPTPVASASAGNDAATHASPFISLASRGIESPDAFPGSGFVDEPKPDMRERDMPESMPLLGLMLMLPHPASTSPRIRAGRPPTTTPGGITMLGGTTEPGRILTLSRTMQNAPSTECAPMETCEQMVAADMRECGPGVGVAMIMSGS